MRALELAGGRAALSALSAMPLAADASTLNGSCPHPRPAGGRVWEAGYVERRVEEGEAGMDDGEKLLGQELQKLVANREKRR